MNRKVDRIDIETDASRFQFSMRMHSKGAEGKPLTLAGTASVSEALIALKETKAGSAFENTIDIDRVTGRYSFRMKLISNSHSELVSTGICSRSQGNAI